MVIINQLIRRPNCLNGIGPKPSILKDIPSIFRKHEINVLFTPRTEIFESLYNVQYTWYSTYTHSIYEYISHLPRIHQGNYYSLSSKSGYSSNVSELSSSENVESVVESTVTCSPILSESQKNSISISFEDHWDDEQIRELEGMRPELFVRGIVFVPAFTTSESKLLPIGSESSYSSGSDGTQSETEEATGRKRNRNELKIYGFISRNRSFHGDEVLAIKSRRVKLPTPETPIKETPGECRVIRVLNRSPNLSNFVATLSLSEFFDDSLDHVKCQPRDSRWPAFKVDKSSMNSDVVESLKFFKPDQKLLCMCSFVDWEKSQMEPRGIITTLMGDVGDPKSQMDATMTFHGLDPRGFSDKLLENLEELIKEGYITKDVNREDLNHLYVLSIDPQDAKDLDDALSIEKVQDDLGNFHYRIGIHIADVSHYVKEESLVDLDARNRATSVYLEHLVYPMLPQQLSENLCSLLPKSEKLCFSVFVDVVESGNGEKIGSDLYIQKVEFKLTSITSKNRLTYDNAKTILYSCLNKKGGKDLDFENYTFQNLEGLIDELDVTDDTKLSLLRLYYLSQKMRYYRLKQLGAVHVDIDGSIKCHIPNVPAELDPEKTEQYLNNKGKLERKFMLRIEKIPKESHELIEEMMLLANTQVAKFLSEKMNLYLLRVHEDTSKAVKSLIDEVLPQNLRKLIDLEELDVTQVLRKCEQYMDPAAFQSLSFSALQKFKEAIYSPISKLTSYENYEEDYPHYHGHWGLALPVYLHFTSPIRRYPDLYTHRMLKNILYSEVKNDSVDQLKEICERCNLQKRRAFDAQKEYKNYAFNKYLQFISSISSKLDPGYLKTLSISKAFTNQDSGENEGENLWGYLYGDACISTIASSGVGDVEGDGNKTLGKTSVVFYIPLLNEQKSISCDSLGITPISIHSCRTKKQKQKVKSTFLKSYYKIKQGKTKGTEGSEEAESKVQGLSVKMREKRMELYLYQKLRVLLVPGSKMWTVRFPVDYLK